MSNQVLLVSLLCLSVSNFLPLAWSRSLSVSLNMSLTRTELGEQRNGTASKLSQEILHQCMRETEISMSQLKLFRLSLLSNDYTIENEVATGTGGGSNDGNSISDIDYSSNQMPYLDLKHNEPLQCFVRCLYERLGLVKYDVLLEEAFRKQVQSIIQREKPEIKECMDLQSKNRCEAAYKLHLCYNHLKTLEAEQRIREVLERSENDNDMGNDEGDNDKEEGIIDGIQHSTESKQ
ncbi:Odorant-binding protein 56c [Drosophila willistoni]|uniref:Odorant-binding protein 56c n=1 Tax=Drosophila willistoni TaxID=7260 RepID=B4MRT8_DROWI|nr:uncharacterized protein LOC6640761 [Drosophila willistoni]EDW74827.1 Odorant-binding protein 56c [Drosophila willistoni]